MRLETEKSGFTGDEGLEKHLVRVYLDGLYETTFSVTYDNYTERLWISYIPERIEVEAIRTPTPTITMGDRDSKMTQAGTYQSSAPTTNLEEEK